MQAGIQTATLMNPDLVGEVRSIVAPVDAEMGRGNGQLIVQTRSGTNQFRGSAVWSVRNSALDANTWSNNRQVDPQTGAWKPVPPDWNNRHQYTGSAGGPISRTKLSSSRSVTDCLSMRAAIQNPTGADACARNGIFRYFDNWNNGNAIQATSYRRHADNCSGRQFGQSLTPATNPDGSPFTGSTPLCERLWSVTGNYVPTTADCSDAAVVRFRNAHGTRIAVRMDSTGICHKASGQDADAEQL